MYSDFSAKSVDKTKYRSTRFRKRIIHASEDLLKYNYAESCERFEKVVRWNNNLSIVIIMLAQFRLVNNNYL